MQILLKAGADINREDNQKNTALAYATQGSRYLVVRLLLDHGADINKSEGDLKYTPLHYAACANDMEPGTTLRFKPDTTIFTVTELSQAVLTSYLRRLSYLHNGIRFTLTVGEDRQEYFTTNGMTDLFTAISAPYQLMHEPIHIVAHEVSLDLEIVMAYQSWKDNHLWCFINNGRAVEGGTHEQGLVQGLKRLKRKLELPENFSNGVVAVASLHYPGAVWEGCIKARIGNPELRTMVSRLVVNESIQWFNAHPAVVAQVRQLQTFQFPEAWSDKL